MKVLVLSLITNIVVATPYRYAEEAIDAELEGRPENHDGKEDEVANHQEVLFPFASPSSDGTAEIDTPRLTVGVGRIGETCR